MTITIAAERLHAEEVAVLRLQTGWEVLDTLDLEQALERSITILSARGPDVGLIGMVRAVGDGVLYAHVQDLIVAQDWRGQGIAARLLDAVLAELDGQMANGSAIGLMAVAGLEPFYASRGFAERPAGPYGAGMTRIRSD